MPNWGDSFVGGLRAGHEVTQGIIDTYKQSKYQQELETELEEARRRLDEERKQSRQTSNAKNDQFLEAQRQSGNQSPLAALVPGLPGGNGGSALDLNSMVGNSNEKISGVGEGEITADSLKSSDTTGDGKALALAKAGTKMQDALLNSSPDGYEFEPVKVGSSRSRRSSGSPRLETNTQPVQAGNSRMAIPVRNQPAQTYGRAGTSAPVASRATSARPITAASQASTNTRSKGQSQRDYSPRNDPMGMVVRASTPTSMRGEYDLRNDPMGMVVNASSPKPAPAPRKQYQRLPGDNVPFYHIRRLFDSSERDTRKQDPMGLIVAATTPKTGQSSAAPEQTAIPADRTRSTTALPERTSAPASASSTTPASAPAPASAPSSTSPAPRVTSRRAASTPSVPSETGAQSAPSTAINLEAVNSARSSAKPISYDELEAKAYRRYNEAVQDAQIKYLIRTNPTEGIKYARQIQEQRAQWDYSDMVRGALAGDTASLEKFLPYVRAVTGQNVELSSDGTQLMVQTADGQTVAKPITGDMIIQASRDFYPIFMLARGMAGDQFMKYVLANQGMDVKQGALDVQRGALDVERAKAIARHNSSSRWKLSTSTDADGNPIIIDQNSGRVFDPEFNALLPPNYTKSQLEARLGSGAKRVDIDGRNGILSEDGNTFLDLESGQFVPLSQLDTEGGEATPNSTAGGNPVGFNDSSVAMLKELEGFSASPYQDYAQNSIGYGTRAKPGDTSITEEEATQRLRDVVETEVIPKLDAALDANGVRLNQEQYNALISICYNVGTDTFLRSKAFQALADGDMQQFVYELSDPKEGFTKVTVDGRLVPNEALVARRRKEAQAFA